MLAMDTNRYVDFARNLPEAVEKVREAERIYVALVVLAECKLGSSADRGRPRMNGLSLGSSTHRASWSSTPMRTPRITTRSSFVSYASRGPPYRRTTSGSPRSSRSNLRLFARDRHFDALPQLSRV